MSDQERPKRPAQPRAVLCPYCGEVSAHLNRCTACGGRFDPLSRQATQNQMGPWFVRDLLHPNRPGRSFATIREMAARGQLKPDTVIRGPTTLQFWHFAGRTPTVANLLGHCHNCEEDVRPDDSLCRWCGADFTPVPDRQHLGLAPMNLLPGQASPEMIAAASDAPAAPEAAAPQPSHNPAPQPQPVAQRPAAPAPIPRRDGPDRPAPVPPAPRGRRILFGSLVAMIVVCGASALVWWTLWMLRPPGVQGVGPRAKSSESAVPAAPQPLAPPKVSASTSAAGPAPVSVAAGDPSPAAPTPAAMKPDEAPKAEPATSDPSAAPPKGPSWQEILKRLGQSSVDSQTLKSMIAQAEAGGGLSDQQLLQFREFGASREALSALGTLP